MRTAMTWWKLGNCSGMQLQPFPPDTSLLVRKVSVFSRTQINHGCINQQTRLIKYRMLSVKRTSHPGYTYPHRMYRPSYGVYISGLCYTKRLFNCEVHSP